MRRSIFGARPTRSLSQALAGRQQARRTFATPTIKTTTPPSPVEPSKVQAHPIGPFYEAILNSAQPIPDVKPEVPPVTSQTAPPSPPIAPAKPAAKPAPSPAAPVPTPAKRGRKPKESAPKDSSSDKAKSVEPSSSSSSSPSPSSSTSSSVNGPSNDLDVQARARVVFGSSLAGPAERAERLAAIRSQSRLVAGVLVPPRPEEPDNCCMSGCVNCVWDRFRDDMEGWASAHAEAERRLRAQESGVAAGAAAAGTTTGKEVGGGQVLARAAAGMDDDGGGSAGNWEVGSGATSPSGVPSQEVWNEELYKNVPVGIREFMKQEKRLKEKHLREGTLGG